MGSFDLKVVVKDLPIDQVFENTGQIPDVPENPRRITDEDFELLKKSIQESPEMKNLDEVKVYPFEGKYIAIGGNHRLRAYKELEWKNVRCKVLPADTPTEKLCEYIMKENMQYASNDPYKLESWDKDKLADWGVVGFEEWDNLPQIEEEQEEPNLNKPVKIQVYIPSEHKELKAELRQKIMDALKEYSFVTVL